MHVVTGVAGIAVVGLLAWLPSRDRGLALRRLQYVALLLVLPTVLAVVLLRTTIGDAIVHGLSLVFGKVLAYAHEGTVFVFGWLAGNGEGGHEGGQPAFFLAVLMPIVFVSALIGILEYTRIMPMVIRWLGRAIGSVSGMGGLESSVTVGAMLIGEFLGRRRFRRAASWPPS